jgi:hypothetical protein
LTADFADFTDKKSAFIRAISGLIVFRPPIRRDFLGGLFSNPRMTPVVPAMQLLPHA